MVDASSLVAALCRGSFQQGAESWIAEEGTLVGLPSLLGTPSLCALSAQVNLHHLGLHIRAQLHCPTSLGFAMVSSAHPTSPSQSTYAVTVKISAVFSSSLNG